MTDDGTGKRLGLSAAQIAKLVIGIVVFGLLLGVRAEFEHIWVRAAVAGCAWGTLGWALLQARKKKVQ
ncbi:MAG: hypothetical protein E6L09_15100 [Verrucomicrobia bacterium]|nr:MAG: hypothetical protein E6L09_15100 [Verrucomicrobiota bacterium]